MNDSRAKKIGVVVIGRNEGERLRRCLRSLVDSTDRLVYVDSGSSDDSVEFAQSLGVDVVDLDMNKPFTMARGRNAGFARLIERATDIDFVQFVDGDCEVVDGWVDAAVRTLEERPDVWVVTGRRRERAPEDSLYNRLADVEWDSPIGEAKACGGDAMMRVRAMTDTGGFNETMIGGEEPELCVRIRQAGGKILRIDQEMTLHDAAILRFGQWWKRAQRGGFAYAHGAALQGRSPARHKVQNLRSVVIWTLALPGLAIVSTILALTVDPRFWIGLGVVAALHLFWIVRNFRRTLRGPLGGRDEVCATILGYLCKWAELQGILGYLASRFRSSGPRLIEYKASAKTRENSDMR